MTNYSKSASFLSFFYFFKRIPSSPSSRSQEQKNPTKNNLVTSLLQTEIKTKEAADFRYIWQGFQVQGQQKITVFWWEMLDFINISRVITGVSSTRFQLHVCVCVCVCVRDDGLLSWSKGWGVGLVEGFQKQLSSKRVYKSFHSSCNSSLLYPW